MNARVLILFTLVALFMQGCKLDPPIYGPEPKEDWSYSYQPLSAGSYWKYTVATTEGEKPDTATITVTGERPIINGKMYYATFNETTIRKGGAYIYSGNHNIAARQIAIDYGNEVTDIQYFNDTLEVGEGWIDKITDDGLLQGVPARVVGTLAEKDITRTVNGVTYPKVAHTHMLLQHDTGNGWETFAIYDYYMNQGIGVIENDGMLPDGTPLGKLLLYEYSIK